ncbi:MAG: 2-dehydropantoate 2-reductase [Proteobacteria bacterium]|nr:2-dehydropantoate 2-reductase [Pseudomonadota bacterium]
MRILVVGAGAIGGYYGGRLLEAGRDVTFLVRPRRAALLAEKGLNIKSTAGDFHAAAPRTVTADAIAAPYDAIILSCKSYDLDSAVADIAPAVGPDTMIVPLLNGMRHLDVLDARFGKDRVLGGQCAIASTLLPDGTVRHMSPMHSLSFGERAGGMSPRVEALAAQIQGAKFDGRASADVMLDMWEKWSFLSAIAAITSLMRAPIGDIVAGGGKDLILQLIEETFGIAARSPHPPRPEAKARAQANLTQAGSLFSASMMRDIEAGNPVEADHVIGDLIARAAPGSVPVLTTAYIHLKSYEARRAREAAA